MTAELGDVTDNQLALIVIGVLAAAIFTAACGIGWTIHQRVRVRRLNRRLNRKDNPDD